MALSALHPEGRAPYPERHDGRRQDASSREPQTMALTGTRPALKVGPNGVQSAFLQSHIVLTLI